MPICITEISTPPKKANSIERGGRKVTDLQLEGQGSGIVEVVKVGLGKGAPHISRPGPVSGVDSPHKREVEIKGTIIRTGIGNRQ